MGKTTIHTKTRGRKPTASPTKHHAVGSKRSSAPVKRDSAKARPAAAAGKTYQVRSYRSALDYLGTLQNFELKPPTIRDRAHFTLGRIKRLLAELDNPQKAFRSVHIAGTKGKGSTATMLACMLQNNALTVGLYTSPHIIDVRERICVNGQMISEASFARLVAQIARIIERCHLEKPTFFEFMTALAFQHFKDREVDVAVVEAGLGGRLDATNVLRPEACVLTNISYDHMAVLGNTLEEIATEKAGIFKEEVPIICAPQSKAIKQVLRKAAEKVGAPILFAGEDIEFSYRFESSRVSGPQARICVSTPTSHFDHLAVPLVGEHQAMNCGVAIGVLDQLKNRGFKIDDEAAIAGLAKVNIKGRMEMICDNPRVIVDVAHNAASIEALMRAIGQNIPCESMVVIFGCCTDKDIDGMLRLIQLGADKIIFTGFDSPRTCPPNELTARFVEISGRMAQWTPNLAAAMEIAEKAVSRGDLICITGSFHLVREAKEFFADHPHRIATS